MANDEPRLDFNKKDWYKSDFKLTFNSMLIIEKVYEAPTDDNYDRF
jgi:hypothetical protein|tara:strand:+ start:665 stop:802 length:138 start_codon:yes stop_codon:yes gene_type:complete